MGKKLKLGIGILLASLAGFITYIVVQRNHLDIFDPAGTIAARERNLMVFTLLLSLIVVIPVFMILFAFAWKYREGNKKARYEPDWDHNPKLELVWWGIPIVIISVLAVVAWTSAHELDPYRALASSKEPLKVQVIALQWRWLFIYPEQHIASVNLLPIPVGRPINFQITSDAPMNSFWIPRLGGQVYAMSGMSTQLHLQASKAGDYDGVSANISGSGFAGMQFTARAESPETFAEWVNLVQHHSGQTLNHETYTALAKPSKDTSPQQFNNVDDGLYDGVIMKYMMPTPQSAEAQTTQTLSSGDRPGMDK